jgi:SAM-dependent methyltransferase
MNAPDPAQAMQAEFDTVAEWTADVAIDLGPDHYLPAGCRGSGSPGVLHWLIDRLAIRRPDRMLDCGAGVGGPAGFVVADTGVRPVLTEPEAGACLAARRLFDLPVIQAGADLPFAAESFDVVWSLGVLCTVADQPHLLTELRRVLAPEGRLGLLVFVAEGPLPEQPSGNHFPTDDGLRAMVSNAGLRVESSASAADFPGRPAFWDERSAAVEAELARRHGHDPVWQLAASQSAIIGRLLGSGDLVGTMLTCRTAD